jgi:hypothetical protein
MKLPRSNRFPPIVGLDLSGGQFRACQVERTKGTTKTLKAVTAALSVDLHHPDAELVGREIKNHLDAAEISARHCVVVLPARWAMMQQTKVPELGPDDAASFLQLEAEKGLPVDPAQLQIAVSRPATATSNYVTQIGVRKEQLDQLSRVLKAAGLKPVSYSLGLPLLPGAVPPAGTGRITVAVDASGVVLLAGAGGGIAALRTFDARIDSEAGEQLVNGAAVARELRITLEQLPPDLRAEVRDLVFVGEPNLVRQLSDALGGWARTAGLAIEHLEPTHPNLGLEMAARLAADRLEGGDGLEFLPPRPSRWTRLVTRYSSKRVGTAGVALGVIVLVGLLAFGWQEFRRWSLRAEWGAMQAQVTALDAVQSRIREYRPFYDTSFRTLTLLKRITECFPDTGAVTAKTVEMKTADVHGSSTVSISGTTRDNAALLRTLDQLRRIKQIQGLKVEQIRGTGKTPQQFTFTFRWNVNSGS